MKLISMDSISRQDLMLIFSKEDKYLQDLHGFLSSRRPKLKYEKKKSSTIEEEDKEVSAWINTLSCETSNKLSLKEVITRLDPSS